MKKRTYELVLWIGGLFLVAAFVYYFITVVFFAAAMHSGDKIKLSKKEKEMVKQFESDCNCDVRLQHNYDLIKNMNGRKFYSSDSVLSISFKSSLGTTILPCSYGDDVLKSHATQTVQKMMKTLSYKGYYNYVNIFYRVFQYGGMESICSKVVRVKLDRRKNIESVKLDRY